MWERIGNEGQVRIFVLWCCYVRFWGSLGFHITVRHVGKPLLQEPSLSTHSFFLGFFSPLLKGERSILLFYSLSFARGTELAVIFPPGRRRWTHPWYTCIRSSLMQASPGHMLLMVCLFTGMTCVPEWARQSQPSWPAQTQTQSWCCTAAATVSQHSGHGPSWWQHKDPAPASELCRFLFPPADGSTWCQKSRAVTSHSLVPVFQTPIYINTVYGCSFTATKSGLGEKRAQELFICQSVGITTC